MHQPHITPLNESALLVSFGNVIDDKLHERVISLYQALSNNPFTGFTEAVPAYASLAVFYNIALVKNAFPNLTASTAVTNILQQLLQTATTKAEVGKKKIIPVYYNGEDIEAVAANAGVDVNTVIALHTARTYKVYMIGFLPGFAYMGIVDERIVMARKATPRTNVPAGSVGIAGNQTGIYPIVSPGGWQLIGQTPLQVFDKTKINPVLVTAGDEVQFTSISKTEFEKLYEYHHY
jgi:inhibitor of KinA